MVKCLTLDKGIVGLSLSGGTILFPCARHVIHYVVLVQPRKRPDMTENFLTAWAAPEGVVTGGPDASPPLERSQKLVFLAILVPLKIANLLGQNSMLGHHRDAIETPFKWSFAGGPMMVSF